MTLKLIVKQHKDIEYRVLYNVKFHHIDKLYLVISYTNNRIHKVRLATVLEIEELA